MRQIWTSTQRSGSNHLGLSAVQHSRAEHLDAQLERAAERAAHEGKAWESERNRLVSRRRSRRLHFTIVRGDSGHRVGRQSACAI